MVVVSIAWVTNDRSDFLFFIYCAHTQTLPACGTYGPAQWVNARQNALTTLSYGGPALDITEIGSFIPFLLYGCMPANATGSDGTVITFMYNALGLVTQWQSSSAASFTATYLELAPGTGTWLNTVEIINPSHQPPVMSYVARYDAEHRIVGLIISEKKRIVQQIEGNTNWHYNSPLFYRPSEVDYGQYGVIAEIHVFTYDYYGNENVSLITSMNLTVQALSLPDVFTHYQYFYNINNTQITKICTNTCAKNQVDFYYDALSRIIGIKELSTGNLSFVHYNAKGQVEVVAHNGKTWTFGYQ